MAKVNYFLKNPLNINVVTLSGLGSETIDMKPIHNFIVVGDVPNTVKSAINSIDAKSSNNILKEYYGKEWKDKLGLAGNKEMKKLFNINADFNFDNFLRKMSADDRNRSSLLSYVNSDEDEDEEGNEEIVGNARFTSGNNQNNEWDSSQAPTNYAKKYGLGKVGGDNEDNEDAIDEESVENASLKLLADTNFSSVNYDNMSFDDINLTADDLEILDNTNIEQPSEDLSKLTSNISVTEEVNLDTSFDLGGKSYEYDISIFPEDKLSELKEKIQLITNIPTYRQYLFWHDNDFLNNTYNLISDNLYEVNIFKHFSNISREQVIFNIAIDKSLYNNRKNIKVESLDYFTTIDYINIDNNQLYVIDLANFINPHRLEMRQFLSDSYQFELFYYGFIIKFWPMMTPEIFHDYIDSEKLLYQKYPMLAFTSQNVRPRYAQQIAISNHNYRNSEKIDKILKGKYSPINIKLSITDVIISTTYSSKQLIDLRVLFDKLKTDFFMPEVIAYIKHENKQYFIKKSFDLNKQKVPFPAAFKQGLIIAIKMNKNVNYKEYVFINVRQNGEYFIKLVLNEEDGYDFAQTLALAKKFTDKIIDDINKHSREISNSKQALVPLTESTVYYDSINVNVIWKKLIKPRAYKFMRAALESYVNANILSIKNFTQIRGHEIMFRKGIVEFDHLLIEKVLAAAKLESIKNYYMYLSNGTLYQKWMQLYDGRVVFMQHRTTDVKFEIINIKAKEFDNFYMYIAGFIFQLLANKEFKEIEQERFIESDKKNKKLKKLNEVDPVLYRLKKYDINKLYSIVCQNPRQPYIYTNAELEKLSDKQKSKLTKYWNFTLNKPAYYGCPNSKYPHFSFIVTIHPKHYCLPCCGKRMTNIEGSKKNLINNICLTKHEFLPEDLEKNKKFLRGLQFKMRHVMNYGKNIDVGRSVRMPQNQTMQDIFYGTLKESGTNYFIQGMNQHSRFMRNIGFIYSLCEITDKSLNDIINLFILALKKDKKLFNMIENGKLLKYFDSLSTFINALENIFLNEMDEIYIQKYNDSDLWNKVFIELSALVMNIYTFILYDEKTTGKNISLQITNSVYNGIRQNNEPSKGIRYIIVFKQAYRYFPVIVATDPQKILSRSETLFKIFTHKDEAIKNFYSIINLYIEQNKKLNQPIDLNLLKFVLESNKEHSLVKKLINMRNLCYAVLIKSKNDELVYLPISYSMNVVDNIDIDFNAFDPARYDLKSEALVNFIKYINRCISKVNKSDIKDNPVNYYKRIIFYKHQTYEGRTIGLLDNSDHLYYINDYNKDLFSELQSHEIYDYELNYYPPEINKLIVEDSKIVVDDRTELLGKSLYKNYLYQLFLVEFNNYIEKQKNTKIRNKINKFLDVKEISQSLSDLQNSIKLVLGNEYKDDAITLNTQIANLYYKGQKNKKDILEMMDNHIYNFDLQAIKHMHGLPKEEIIQKLNVIVPRFCVEGNLPDKMTLENIYVPCEYKDQDFCKSKKLVVEPGKMAVLIDLLADDILNPIKMKYLTSGIFTEKIINYFNFERNPNESITISAV